MDECHECSLSSIADDTLSTGPRDDNPLAFGLLVLNGMDLAIEIIGATRHDALAIANIHLAARAQHVVRLHIDDETRSWFAGIRPFPTGMTKRR